MRYILSVVEISGKQNRNLIAVYIGLTEWAFCFIYHLIQVLILLCTSNEKEKIGDPEIFDFGERRSDSKVVRLF